MDLYKVLKSERFFCENTKNYGHYYTNFQLKYLFN